MACEGSSPAADPCQGVTCSGHGICAISGGKAICACDKGYFAEGLECRPLEPQDPCLGVACSGHGDCIVQDDAAVCVCDMGYHPQGLACLENDPQDPCLGVDCSGRGTCRIEADGPVCECQVGYHPVGLSCVKDTHPCDGITCSGHGQCLADENQEPFCQCDAGYHSEDLTCVENRPEPCDGVTCSGHGSCELDGNDQPRCACEPGYHPVDLNCLPDDPEPCDGVACSGHGRCVAEQGAARCECDAGYHPEGLACAADTSGDGLPIWFLHITDCHFGESAVAASLTTTFFSTVVPAIEPVAAINTGDETDGGSSYQWLLYQDAAAGAPPYPQYFEIPGNHDKKSGDGQPFIASSWTGRAGGGFFGLTHLGTTAGPVRAVRVDTADSTMNAVNIAGILGSAQAAQLVSLIDSDTSDSRFSIIAAHHPMLGLEQLRLGADSMQQIIDRAGALIYLCGHTHRAEIGWLGRTLHVMGPSLGKTSPTTYSLVSLDTTGPAVRLVQLSSSPTWPVTMITSPADAALAGVNPHAGELPAAASVTVRALAFAPGGISKVEVQLGDGPWVEMARLRDHVYQVDLTLPGLAGNTTLRARASAGSGTDVHEITVKVK
ncbi:MAG: hypothetical protein GYA21_08765 [Myxococcales bacterium]|nr:hypothetical protein [Myxococcales bacterium]